MSAGAMVVITIAFIVIASIVWGIWRVARKDYDSFVNGMTLHNPAGSLVDQVAEVEATQREHKGLVATLFSR